MDNLILYIDDDICFNGKALEKNLAGEGYAPLRDTLIAIVAQEHEFTKQKRAHMEGRVAESDDDIGFGGAFAVSSANLDAQIEALGYLAPLLEKDDIVYETLWRTALGNHSNVRNLAYAAIGILGTSETRKTSLELIADDPKAPYKERITAIEALLIHRFPHERDAFKRLLKLTEDTSIEELYKMGGVLSPPAQFEYEMQRKYHLKEGRTEGETKQYGVDKAQWDFRQGAFEVLDHLLNHQRERVIGYLSGHHHEREILTRHLAHLISERPNHHVSSFINYVRQITPDENELRTIYGALKRGLKGEFMESYEDGIVGVLTEIYPRVRKQL